MKFLDKRKKQLNIKSLGDKRREGRIGEKGSIDKVIGPPEFDCLEEGWCRGEVMGVVGDSGSGKTEVVLMSMMDILINHPESNAVFVSLEMTDQKIANRWYKMTEDHPGLEDRFYIISRYDEEGKAYNISMDWIKSKLNVYRDAVGDVAVFAIDHLHVIGENDASSLNSICTKLKEMAVEMNAFGMVLAQVSKGAGQGGEVPLSADAVLGCSQFKYICSDIMQIHRPIKRLEDDAGISVLGYGYCKVRESSESDPMKAGQNKVLAYNYESRSFEKLTAEQKKTFKTFYDMMLEIRENEEKHKQYVYDLSTRLVGPNGKVVIMGDAAFSGSREED